MLPCPKHSPSLQALPGEAPCVDRNLKDTVDKEADIWSERKRSPLDSASRRPTVARVSQCSDGIRAQTLVG